MSLDLSTSDRAPPKVQSALALAASGFNVFPVQPDTKVPKAELPWKEAATTNLDTIERWWRENPDYNIGVAAGKGLLVIDVDTKLDKQGLESLDMLDMLGLPDSVRVQTPSGGTHIYLRSDEPFTNRVGTIDGYPGLDIRTDGGYVLGPGSTIHGKPYSVKGRPVSNDNIEPAEAWLCDILRTRSMHTPKSDQPLTELDRQEHVDKAVHYLKHQAHEAVEGAGGNDATYRVATRLRDFAISESLALELMLEHWNEEKASPPWNPDELATVVRNGYKYASGGWGAGAAAAEFGEVDIDIGEPPSRPVVKVPQKGDLCLPYRWCEPSLLPPREWLLGRHLIRKFVSITIAPGNIGKSSLVIAEALEMATGRNLIGHALSRPLNVWYWNLEDPYDELQRRIQAACLRFDVTEDSIQGRLFVNSGRDHPLCLAQQGSAGAEICQPVADRLVQALIEKSIDVLIIDPFVSSHSVSENDNMAIDAVVKEWGRVADRANIAIELVHHTRKAGGNDHETTTESARGGKALTDAARDVRVLNRMTKDEGKKAGVENPRLHFRTYSDKGNMAPPADSSEWFKLEGVPLGNSDDVGVVVAWTWPDAFAEITADQIRRVQNAIEGHDFRADVRADEWVGHAVADCLNMDLANAMHKSSINAIVKEWIRIGVLLVETRTNDKGRDQDFVLPGRAPDDV